MKAIADLLSTRTTPFTFSILHTLLRACGLDVDLQSYAHSITLFAPPDEVFGRLQEKTPFDLMQDIQKLWLLLSFHMVPLSLARNDLHTLWEQAQSPTIHTLDLGTISGYPLHITLTEPLTVENASVLMADLSADNGIVHVIDHVLWPPGLHEASFHGNTPFQANA